MCRDCIESGDDLYPGFSRSCLRALGRGGCRWKSDRLLHSFRCFLGRCSGGEEEELWTRGNAALQTKSKLTRDSEDQNLAEKSSSSLGLLWNGGVVEQAAHKLVLVVPVADLLRLTSHLFLRAREDLPSRLQFPKPTTQTAVPNLDAATAGLAVGSERMLNPGGLAVSSFNGRSHQRKIPHQHVIHSQSVHKTSPHFKSSTSRSGQHSRIK